MTFRNTLAVTTALSAVALLAAQAATAAEKPKLKLSGYQETFLGFGDTSGGTGNGTPTYAAGVTGGAFKIIQYGEIRFNATGTTDSGMKWGVYFELAEDDATDAAKKQGGDETNLWLSGSWGKLEIGGQDGAADKMQIDASELALMDHRLLSVWQDTRGNSLRGAEDQISIQDTSDATKLTYYTPSISGVQAGLSYVPSKGSEGSVPASSSTGQVEAGLTYKGKVGDAKVSAAAVYTNLGNVDGSGDQDGIALGATVGFGAFSVTAGWSQNDNWRAANSEQNGYTAGVNYNGGKWQTTLLYIHNELELDAGGADDEYDAVHLQGAYNLGGGLTAALQLAAFDLDARTTANDNTGFSAIAGINAKF